MSDFEWRVDEGKEIKYNSNVFLGSRELNPKYMR